MAAPLSSEEDFTTWGDHIFQAWQEVIDQSDPELREAAVHAVAWQDPAYFYSSPERFDRLREVLDTSKGFNNRACQAAYIMALRTIIMLRLMPEQRAELLQEAKQRDDKARGALQKRVEGFTGVKKDIDLSGLVI